MTRLLITALFSAIVAAPASAQSPTPTAPDTRLFELRVYHAAKGKFDALNARLRDQSLRLFEKHGMANVGYWASGEGPDQKVVFLLAHPDRAARDRAWTALTADPEWMQVRQSTEAGGKLVARIEEVFLTPTDFSPAVTPTRAEEPRVFELRVFAAEDGNLGQLLARTRSGLKSLKKEGVECVGSWTLAAGQPGANSILVCLLARHPSPPRSWNWVVDPTLITALLTGDDTATSPDVRKTELLRPMDYSPLK